MKRIAFAFVLVTALVLVGCQATGRGNVRPVPAPKPTVDTSVTEDTTATPHNESLGAALLGARGSGASPSAAGQSLTLEAYDGGFFSLKKPKGWQIVTAGAYGSFAFLLTDPSNPARQVLYMGEVVPFYQSQKQKDIDTNYMRTGGKPVGWADMPVVSPLTPAQFFIRFEQIAKSKIGTGFMSQLPRLSGFKVLADTPAPSALKIGKTSLVTGYFVRSGVPCEGQFLATVAPYMPFMNGPGGGTGIAGHVVGIMAPVGEFAGLEDDLAACVDSFRFNADYVRAGVSQSRENFKGVMAAGQTLREASQIITDGWAARNKSIDIVAEKNSDATLGYERLYDPATGTVYQVESRLFDAYQSNPGRYDMSGLQPLPGNDHSLWTATPRDGSEIH